MKSKCVFVFFFLYFFFFIFFSLPKLETRRDNIFSCSLVILLTSVTLSMLMIIAVCRICITNADLANNRVLYGSVMGIRAHIGCTCQLRLSTFKLGK